MSYRSRRVERPDDVQEFVWSGQVRATPDVVPAARDAVPCSAGGGDDVAPAPPSAARLAEIERDAFAKGYQQGERAGVEAGNQRAEAMLRRLAETIDELSELRRTMIHQTERQMVELALAVARRVVRREVAIDHDLTLTLARVALERLGESTAVTIHLHPDDHAAIVGQHAPFAGQHVSLVADSAVARGGCLVESDFGFVDASVDAQFQELARALLDEEGQEVGAELHVR